MNENIISNYKKEDIVENLISRIEKLEQNVNSYSSYVNDLDKTLNELSMVAELNIKENRRSIKLFIFSSILLLTILSIQISSIFLSLNQ